jgi:hypothetical protein
MFTCVLILNSVNEPIRGLKQTVTALEVGLGKDRTAQVTGSEAGKKTDKRPLQFLFVLTAVCCDGAVVPGTFRVPRGFTDCSHTC